MNLNIFHLLIPVIFSFLFVQIVYSSDDIKIYEFSRNKTLSYPGKRFSQHVFQEFSTKRQVIHCAYECLKSKRCQSFNYDRSAWVCQLNDATHHDFGADLENATAGENVEYHLRDAFSIEQEALGPCALEPCQNGARCLDTVNSRMERTYYCICEDGWAGENCESELHRIDWADWESWGPCSVTCQAGWTTRRRRCVDTVTDQTLPSTQCYGRDVEYQACTLPSCPRWEGWGEWGPCSTRNTCGRGVKHRSRKCSNGGTPGVDRYCLGFVNDTAPCQGISCQSMLMLEDKGRHGEGRIEILDDKEDLTMPVCADDKWNFAAADIVCRQIGFLGSSKEGVNHTYNSSSVPSSVSVYSVSCGGTEQTIQACRRDKVDNCSQLAGVQCRIRGGWSLWTPWGDCSVTCENGTRTRTRECNHPPPNFGGIPCPDDHIQYKGCQLPMCPRNGTWGHWETWSGCGVTCGEGERIRHRQCVDDIWPCVGTNVTFDICTVATPCPVDGVWASWSSWSACDVTCANGTRYRTRNCTGPFYGGAACPGPANDSEPCFPRMCEVDGVWSNWTEWSSCSHTCGYGSRNRSRTCKGPFYGGLDCPGSADDIETCNAFSCPVDGSWKPWEQWGSCNVTCGGGTRYRTRDCNDPLHGGAGCNGTNMETETCNNHFCPIDGVFTDWAVWTACSVTCANGTRSRNRTCHGPYFKGKDCVGDFMETEVCVAAECPVDGVWDNWQQWLPCNVTCGGGGQLRHRKCIGPFYGGAPCNGSAEDEKDCNMHPCPIDGYWDLWAPWAACNVSCGGGFQIRTRPCVEPRYGGANCTGTNEDRQECNTHSCPVDGEWQSWAPWAPCSVTCGNGTTSRTRQCYQPKFGGKTCSGISEENTTCTTIDCPIDGVWEAWTNWTQCSHVCGGGQRERFRNCTGPFYGGAECNGTANETEACNTHPCPIDGVYAEWTVWSACSRTCGRGSTSRNRTCFGPYHGGAPCKGPDFETEFCFPSSCPVHGLWNPWTLWSDCSTTCENGTRARNRTCDGPYYGGDDCQGNGTEVEECFLRMCPVDGVWEDWTTWDQCPVTCGGAIQNRTRVCIGPFHGGANCTGPTEESRDCGIEPCPVDGDWSLWSLWSTCNVTCGGGTSGRHRFCSETKHGGANCTGDAKQYRDCNAHECPIDGVWEMWTNWTECSLTCGRGQRDRYRNCTGPFHGGAECVGAWNQTEDCNTHNCPIRIGQWSEWRVWSICSHSCGGGKQLRVRTCESAYEGTECEGPQQQWRDCNTHHCSVDGIWESWMPWSSCNVTCGGGSRSRSRDCHGPYFGGAECPGLNISRELCNTQECPIDGVWETWTIWEDCSVTCGGGNQSRFRNCTGPFHGGSECVGEYNQTRDCNTFECPVDGVLSPWSGFYSCNATCGGGIQWRNRTCIGPFYGGANCTDPLEESRECNTHNCPIDGVYSLWSPWEQCDVTCGGGIQWRNRTCNGPYYGGADCVGPDKENRTCNDFNCPVDGVWKPWSDWDTCIVTCGGANHSRYRVCDGPFYGGANCSGADTDTRECNTQPCPVDGVFLEWSAWQSCNVTCGGGMQWRNRSCHGPFHGGDNCTGPYDDSQSCNSHECPIDGVWNDWGTWANCSVTCGGGLRLRQRTCNGPFYNGSDCVGPVNDTEICGTALCPIPGLWFEWTSWTLCSTTCGGGTRERNRTCDWNSYGNLTIACEGPEEEVGDCHTFNCTPLARHCAEWAARGLNQSCMADVDPDGAETVYDPVEVECDFDSEPGKAFTLLHHDQENRTRVKGYEGAGEYRIELKYFVGWAEAIKIIDTSAECKQFMRWDCKAAIIHNPYNPEMLTTYWMNRTEQITNYFGGATPGSGNCACGETNSCFNTSLPCNCDENDEVWRFDEGYVTNKVELPIHSFFAGDTGGDVEDGYKLLGPVMCAGFA